MASLKGLKGCLSFVGLVAANAASGQVTSISSAVVTTHVVNGIPGAIPTVVNAYPTLLTLGEAGVSAPTGVADRDVWQYSNNGTTAYPFQNGDYFQTSFNLTLTDVADSPRKEAGFLLHTVNDGDIQFLVDSDAHEVVVQLGGITFYSFNVNNGTTYQTGQTITLGMQYFRDGNNKNALEFSANSIESPVLELGPTVGSGATDIGDGSTLGGFFQIDNAPTDPGNSGTAAFASILIEVPEPPVSALLGLGVLLLAIRRRRY